MKRFAWLIGFVLLALCGTLGSAAAEGQGDPAGGGRGIRLFVMDRGEKHYFTGFDWLQFDVNQKLGLVEMARSQAAELNVVVALAAEIYVAELDRMFTENPEVQHIEIGPAIQGVAITLKDWDDGSDPREKLAAYTAQN